MYISKVPKESVLQHFISKEDISELPLFKYQGPISIVNSNSELISALKKITKNKILGFDTESKPSFKKGIINLPSIIQLATHDTVFIFQVEAIGGINKLIPLFTNQKIKKVGVAISDDLKRLKKIESFIEKGFIEITSITRKRNIQNRGLRGLAALLLDYRISKGAQTSNWSNKVLTETQVSYAATDAWVSREIYMKLENYHLL